MVGLVESLSKFEKQKVLIIGDLMLDTYTIGKVMRISPEAPVSVLSVTNEEQRPGGAGNVALNLKALGMDPILIGRVGRDEASLKLCKALKNDGIDASFLVIQENYKVPVKNRIIAEHQQMMRVDFEEIIPLEDEEAFVKKIHSNIDHVKVIAISDYAKGLLSISLLEKIFEIAKSKSIKVIVDPKGTDFIKYKGASYIKPNLSEAILASGGNLGQSLDLLAQNLINLTQSEALFITRSEEGISLFKKDEPRKDFSVKAKQVKDVTGAGDTVLSMLAAAIANEVDLENAIKLANISAGIAIEYFGCAKVTMLEVAGRMLEMSVENKIFDEKHLFALKLILINRPFTLLSLEAKEGMTNAIFKALRELRENKEHLLIVYIKDGRDHEEFVSLLASLSEVDFIVLKSDSLNLLCKELQPSRVYSLIHEDIFS
jgi:rfaE bifunctional protein kinase chain/domain